MADQMTPAEPLTWAALPRSRRQRLAVLLGQLAWRMTQNANRAEGGHEPLGSEPGDAAEQGRGPAP